MFQATKTTRFLESVIKSLINY